MRTWTCLFGAAVCAVISHGRVAGGEQVSPPRQGSNQGQAAADRLAWAAKLSQESEYALRHCREFYVDPTCKADKNGGDGSQARPWSSLDRRNEAAWNSLAETLAGGHVTVYFSARQADKDTPEELPHGLVVPFAGHDTHRLTFDGMSKWNTDDVAPNWAWNTGKTRCRFSRGGGLALGRPGRDGLVHNVTYRGFEISGPSARIMIGGNNTILEHIYSHDITAVGPALHTAQLVPGGQSSLDSPVRYSNVIIRNCVIERCYGEGMYIAGVYETQTKLGEAHSNFLIENNRVSYAGANGAEGDGIEIKVGLTGVTVRHNTVDHSSHIGIACNGTVLKGTRYDLLVEGNTVSQCSIKSGVAIRISAGWGYCKDAIVRNNVVFANHRRGIYTLGKGEHQPENLDLYCNTVYNNRGGIDVSANRLTLLNNLVFANGLEAQVRATERESVRSDYNAYCGRWDVPGEGPHSITVRDASVLCVDPGKGDFHLKPGSPCIDAGDDVGVNRDRDGKPRPQGEGCDIGACEFAAP